MNEAEAEAVLLALAEPMQWEQWGDSIRWNTDGVPPEMTDVYAIHILSEGGTARYQAKRDGHRYEEDPLLHASFDEAKAACERHRATGKWR